jgi:hypothetical protein
MVSSEVCDHEWETGSNSVWEGRVERDESVGTRQSCDAIARASSGEGIAEA